MKSTIYPTIEPNPNFAELEEKVLDFWKRNRVFEASVAHRPLTSEGKNNAYVFYDGPPFANGLPHYGHLLTGYVKDAVARYHTMHGKRVERRFGWDCHGLPAEMGAEKDLGISGRSAIMKYGIDKFNAHCESSVMKYTHEWEYYVTRQARWVDFQNDYKTMDTNFMESVLWAFNELYKKDLVYESFRVMPYSWAAETPVSNFETRMDNATREREDKAAYVKFKLKEKPKGAPDAEAYYLVAWTTTPWTLPANLALVVSADISYRCYVHEGICLIASATNTVIPAKAGIQTDAEVDSSVRWNDVAGEALLGISYEPIFPYFADTPNGFCIIDGTEFITEGDGTGVVHIAPGFGEDDQRVATKNNIALVVPVNEKGRYTDEIYDLPDLKLQGMNVVAETQGQLENEPFKPEQVAKYGLVNLRIIAWLKQHGMLVHQEEIKHNYPHCWRTDTPLIYRAMSSWYVAVTKFRDRAVELNREINWIPGHVRDGQMGHMLATAPDWSISRNRFWGTPIPIWRSSNPNSKEPLKVFGSIAELEAFFGVKIENLHRPFIDSLVASDGDGHEYRRVEDVFDCWFESGSMPFAQLHYPFENEQLFRDNFPGDFITEYVGQTRGWFNTLIMISTALFDKPPFKNCICHGVVIDAETGLKYSKRLKNYKDPKEVMDVFGADALRWMMLSSPVMRGADIGVDPEGKFIRDVVRLNIKPIWNAFNFFTLYANADGIPGTSITRSENLLDRYILAKCKAAVEAVKQGMDAYDMPTATTAITAFFEVLNNWYIRRSRARFWAEQKSDDKEAAYDTLYTVLELMCRAAAPLLPLTMDAVYLGLTRGDGTKAAQSVHLQDFPDVSAIDDAIQIIAHMDWVRDVCNAASSIRNKQNIRNRQPLNKLTVVGTADAPYLQGYVEGQENGSDWYQYVAMIKEEVNVESFSTSDTGLSFDDVAELKLKINAATLGKHMPQKMKEIITASKKGEWKALQLGGIHIAGVELHEEYYQLLLEPKASYVNCAAPLSSNDALAILDLEISEELAAKGIARDVVRLIQQARKDAGLDVSDRVALTLQMPPDAVAAVDSNSEYIKDQTLADTLTHGDAAIASHRFTQEIDGETWVVGVSKAA